jgi:FAD binding domain/Berberine and berberine like
VPLSQDAIAQFRGQLRGEVIAPADPAYEESRKVFNAMISKKPALIAKCADVADVMAAVNFARANSLLTAVRSGGHNAGGLGICDGGLVIDLSRIKYVHVDPASRTVRVGGGCVWADVDHATHAFGLAVPSGIISTTGVGGLTLGGGLGHLTRKCGLTIDNLLAADVVLADGRFVVASAKENTDLFWALRGGGGNFGIVTSFLFQAHPVSTVIAGPMLWELERTPEVLKFYRDFIVKAPNDVNGFFAVLTVPPIPLFPEPMHLKKMCGIVWCHTGSLDQANNDLAPVRKNVPPAFEHVGPIPFPMLQSFFDPLFSPGLQSYWKADFFKELPDAVIPIHQKFGGEIPTMLSTMHLYPINGAAHRASNGDTAWAYREANWSGIVVGVDPDPANAPKITDWSRAYYDALHPFGAGGAYVNFMMDEGEDRIRATYRGNYARLAQIKAKYDPENFFRVNQNIKPSA